MSDDDLERRLRGALNRPRPSDTVDTDDFLTRVHHGANVRRVKRGVTVAAASVLVLTGGGLVINATGVLGGSQTPVAGPHTTPSPGPGTDTAAHDPITTNPSRSRRSTHPNTTPQTVTISPNGPISADQIRVVSLTATGTDHQWVLASTPGQACGQASCATVFSTDHHGATGTWTDVGHLPPPPAGVGQETDETVGQLRFTQRTDGSGRYDGWAYGHALWSTHDSGKTWSSAARPPGDVTQLESWGDNVYAGISSPVQGDDTATLYRSPTTRDSWSAVSITGKGDNGIGDLAAVQAIAAAKNVVGLIDAGNGADSAVVYASLDGNTWLPTQPCPSGTNATDLSTASDPTGTVSALWVTCRGLTESVILVTDTHDLGSWQMVPNDSFAPNAIVAAQSPTLAFVAGDNVSGIQRVPLDGAASTVPAVGVGPPVLFAFTNQSYGYLLDAEGNMLSTTTGGTSWAPYRVSGTQN